MKKYIIIIFLLLIAWCTPSSFAMQKDLPVNPFWWNIKWVPSGTSLNGNSNPISSNCNNIPVEYAYRSLMMGLDMLPLSCNDLWGWDWDVTYSVLTNYSYSWSLQPKVIWWARNIDASNWRIYVTIETQTWAINKQLFLLHVNWRDGIDIGAMTPFFEFNGTWTSRSDNPINYSFLWTYTVRMDRNDIQAPQFSFYLTKVSFDLFLHNWNAVSVEREYPFPSVRLSSDVWGSWGQPQFATFSSFQNIYTSSSVFYSYPNQDVSLVSTFKRIRTELWNVNDFLPSYFSWSSSIVASWSYVEAWWFIPTNLSFDYSSCWVIWFSCYFWVFTNGILSYLSSFFPNVSWNSAFNSCASWSTGESSYLQKFANIIAIINPYPPAEGTIVCSIFWQYTIWYQRLIPEKNFFEIYIPWVMPSLENDGRIIFWQSIPDIIVILSFAILILNRKQND